MYAEQLRQRHGALPGAADGDCPDGARRGDAAPARPALVLVRRQAGSGAGDRSDASPAAGAEGGGVPAGEASSGAQAAQPVDAQVVADRVYELMKQEVLLGRMRGASVVR